MEKYYFTFSKELNGALQKEIEPEGSTSPSSRQSSNRAASNVKNTNWKRTSKVYATEHGKEHYMSILVSADGGIKPIKGSGDSLRSIQSLEIPASDSTLSVALVAEESDIGSIGKTILEQESGNFTDLLNAVLHSEELVVQGTDFFTIRSGSTDITYVDIDVDGIVIKVTYKDEGKLSSGHPSSPAI